jgi:hypothetical protein
VAAVLIVLTSSFDIFLVVEVGANFRVGQFLAMMLIVLAIARTIHRPDLPTLGLAPLLAWLAIQIVFISATTFWPKSVGYCFWLALNIGLMFSFVQLFSGNGRALHSLLRWYLYSFGIIAVFGLVQFALPLFGLPAPLVTQWWIINRIPRLNGFSYEPSYYAAYLLIGFVLCGSLRNSEFRLLAPSRIRTLRWLIGFSIILSSSRLGISFVLLDVLLRGRIRSWRVAGRLSLAGALIAAGVILFAKERPETAIMLLAGTGIYGAPAHSVVERANSFVDTLTVFTQHPFIGRSLGGVSSGIAELHGVEVRSFQDSKPYEGMAIFAEVLAGSGIFGVVPFVVFLIVIVRKPLEAARHSSPEYSILLRALTRALVFELAVLQFNQNILRPYLWTHLAILATVYAAARPFPDHLINSCRDGVPVE